MNSYELFKLMFDVMDVAYDDNPNENLGNYLSSLNPYLFKGENSAATCEYEEFKEEFIERFSEKTTDANAAYDFCLKYVKRGGVKEAIKAFGSFDKKIWEEVFIEVLAEQND